MADMLADGAAWLTAQRTAYLSQTVTLHRGGKKTTGVKATKCPVRADSDPTVNVDINHADWIIAVDQYLIDGAATEPTDNTDFIEEASGERWKVTPLANEPSARFSDPYNTAWRIHTERIQGPD